MSEHQSLSKFATIRQSIATHGYYVYLVQSGPSPRFLYTIGLCESVGVELLLAGAVVYDADDAKRIVDRVAHELLRGASTRSTIAVESVGEFTLRSTHQSWVDTLLLGAVDYYRGRRVGALQIVPDDTHRTIDVPNAAIALTADAEPIWRWQIEEWRYSVSAKSMVVTNLAALRGESVTEVARWEDDHWEAFAGPLADVPRDEIYVVPLGTLFGSEETLAVVVSLPVGTGLWREGNAAEWQPFPLAAGGGNDPAPS